MYFTIIGDLVKSKALSDRLSVQESLRHTLSDINNIYKEHIASNFIITIGDEFQGVLYNCTKLFEIITRIELIMHPVKIRFGVGYGEMSTAINREQALGSDGPAWWSAREAVAELKDNHERGIRQLTNIRLKGIQDKPVSDLINAGITCLNTLKSRWKEDHRAIIKHIIARHGLSSTIVQTKIAKELNIAPNTLNKKLKTSNYMDYAYMYEKIITVLERING